MKQKDTPFDQEAMMVEPSIQAVGHRGTVLSWGFAQCKVDVADGVHTRAVSAGRPRIFCSSLQAITGGSPEECPAKDYLEDLESNEEEVPPFEFEGCYQFARNGNSVEG